jgi:glycosyltransferase involved in cell wall biosynthesis
MIKENVVISSHAVFVGDRDVFGPGHAVSGYLNFKKIPHLYIKHSLYDSRPSIVEKNNKIEATLKLSGILPGFFRLPLEVISVLLFLRNRKVKVFIAIDPINALAAIIGKKLGRINTTIFYTADYARNRFSNRFMNFIYHTLDKFAVKNSDVVWNVSTRIKEVRKRQGLEDEKNILVPNSPLVKDIKQHKKVNQIKRSMVLMANFTHAIDHGALINAVFNLKKKYKDVLLVFIGSGELENDVKAMTRKKNLEENILFLGYLDHDVALDNAAKYSVGLAPYAKSKPWTEFGDSLKAREYMALGLPVIISDTVSTGDDIRSNKAGYSIKMNASNLYKSLDVLFSSEENFQRMKINALRLADQYDLEKILDKELLQKYL